MLAKIHVETQRQKWNIMSWIVTCCLRVLRYGSVPELGNWDLEGVMIEVVKKLYALQKTIYYYVLVKIIIIVFNVKQFFLIITFLD